MSFEALTWAVKQNTANSGQKLVLLMLANYTNPDTGQCNPSQKRLAEKCCMSLASVKRHIESLEKAGLLSVQNNYRNGGLVTCQYILNLSSNCTNPQSDLSQPLAQIELQKHKEETEKENNIDLWFETLWKQYPKKVGKKNAKAQFVKVNPDDQLFEQIMRGLMQYKQTDPVKKGYIRDPERWIRDRRWEDEHAMTQKSYTGLESAI